MLTHARHRLTTPAATDLPALDAPVKYRVTWLRRRYPPAQAGMCRRQAAILTSEETTTKYWPLPWSFPWYENRRSHYRPCLGFSPPGRPTLWQPGNFGVVSRYSYWQAVSRLSWLSFSSPCFQGRRSLSKLRDSLSPKSHSPRQPNVTSTSVKVTRPASGFSPVQ